MKTKLFSILALATALTVSAQTNSPAQTNQIVFPPGTPAEVPAILGFLNESSNLMVIPYGIYSSGPRDYGAGIALAYKFNDYAGAAYRADWLAGKGNLSGFYQMTLGLNLEYPIVLLRGGLLTKAPLMVVPFGFAGAAMPFGGAGSKNHSAQAVVAVGGALRLDSFGAWGKHIDLIGDYEEWTAITTSKQYRFGFVYKF